MTYRKTPFKMVIKTRFIIYLLRKDSNKKELSQCNSSFLSMKFAVFSF